MALFLLFQRRDSILKTCSKFATKRLYIKPKNSVSLYILGGKAPDKSHQTAATWFVISQSKML